MLYVNNGTRLAYLTSIVNLINNADENRITMFGGPMPEEHVLRDTDPSDFLAGGYIATINLPGSALPAKLASTNDGLDIVYEPEDDVNAVSGGEATWFMFNIGSEGILRISGTCGTPEDKADMTMLNKLYVTGRPVDFQDIKIRMFRKSFGV